MRVRTSLSFKSLMRKTGSGLQHEKDNENCWCKPSLVQVCPEADDYCACKPECFRCNGSSKVEAYDLDEPYWIIHQDL